jgi:hypothetical protein
MVDWDCDTTPSARSGMVAEHENASGHHDVSEGGLSLPSR